MKYLEKIRGTTQQMWSSSSLQIKMMIPTLLIFTGLAVVLYFYVSTLYKKTILNEQIDKARSVVTIAEATRDYVAKKNAMGLYKPIPEGLSDEEKQEWLLHTIPIFAAIEIFSNTASKIGSVSHVRSEKPRNPEHEATEEDRKILSMLATKKQKEYSVINEQKKTLTYYRPIILTEDCMACHGSPKKSEYYWGRKDGKDITGRLMEGKKVGDMHGAFVLIISLETMIDTINRATIYIAGGILVFLLLALYSVHIISVYVRSWLQRIAYQQRLLSQGIRGVRIDKVSQDELGTLADGFNNMAEAIERGIDDIEEAKKVVEHKVKVAVAEKQQLLNIVAHDLKNPLAGLLLSSDKLIHYQKIMTEEQLRLTAERIQEATKRMLGLVERILTVNTDEDAIYKPQVEVVNLESILTKLHKENEQQLQHKKLHLIVKNNLINSVVKTDCFVLRQILDNLLSNAIKYSPANRYIFLRVTELGERKIIFEIEDQGIGIKSEEISKLFLPYTTLSSKPTGNESSSGIGLSIVKNLVDVMNGSISVESEWGKGSIFRVELPVQVLENSTKPTLQHNYGYFSKQQNIFITL